jgi:hypothetical protein
MTANNSGAPTTNANLIKKRLENLILFVCEKTAFSTVNIDHPPESSDTNEVYRCNDSEVKARSDLPSNEKGAKSPSAQSVGLGPAFCSCLHIMLTWPAECPIARPSTVQSRREYHARLFVTFCPVREALPLSNAVLKTHDDHQPSKAIAELSRVSPIMLFIDVLWFAVACFNLVHHIPGASVRRHSEQRNERDGKKSALMGLTRISSAYRC